MRCPCSILVPNLAPLSQDLPMVIYEQPLIMMMIVMIVINNDDRGAWVEERGEEGAEEEAGAEWAKAPADQVITSCRPSST